MKMDLKDGLVGLLAETARKLPDVALILTAMILLLLAIGLATSISYNLSEFPR